MTDKKMQRIIDGIKKGSLTAFGASAAIMGYLVVGKGDMNSLDKVAVVLTFLSVVIGFFLLALLVGAWNTKKRGKFMEQIYQCFVTQLIVLCFAVILVGINLDLI